MKAAVTVLVAAALVCAGAAAHADGCTQQAADALTQRGYWELDAHRWADAKTAAGELALYVQKCNDPDVAVPSAVQSAYIGAVALHHLGDDAKASEAIDMGLTVLNLLHQNGGYEALYRQLRPKFAALQSQLKT